MQRTACGKLQNVVSIVKYSRTDKRKDRVNSEAIIPNEISMQVQAELVRRRKVHTGPNGQKRIYFGNNCFSQMVVCGEWGELQDFIAGQETDITKFDEALVKKLIRRSPSSPTTSPWNSSPASQSISRHKRRLLTADTFAGSEEPWSVFFSYCSCASIRLVFWYRI